MPKPQINKTVLMSGTDHFSVEELNPYSHAQEQPKPFQASQEHAAIVEALESAGVEVIKVPAPEGCQDGVYVANWALCRGDKVVLSSLPNKRSAEEPFAEKYLREQGKEVIKSPYRFSGQGDALPCGNLLFCGSTYRTDPEMHEFLADKLGFEVISLETIPALGSDGKPVTNTVTGWPDSFFYDLDLALAVLRDDLIAYCPEAFTDASRDKLKALPIEKIEVTYDEAVEGFACNLVSTGSTVIMSDKAPLLAAQLEAHGFEVITPEISELAKGGGYIRCTTLTLDNI